MRRWICLLSVLALLMLAGCGPVEEPDPTVPSTTVPLQTPQQMLGDAVEGLRQASSFTLRYVRDGAQDEELTLMVAKDTRGGYQAHLNKSCGCGVYISGSTMVKKDCETGQVQRLTQASYYGLDVFAQELPQIEPGLVERFAQLRLMASPSDTGSMCFSVDDINYGDQCFLIQGLYPPGSDGEPDDFGGFLTMTLNGGGQLAQLEYKDPTWKETVIHKLTFADVNQQTVITKPDWA